MYRLLLKLLPLILFVSCITSVFLSMAGWTRRARALRAEDYVLKYPDPYVDNGAEFVEFNEAYLNAKADGGWEAAACRNCSPDNALEATTMYCIMVSSSWMHHVLVKLLLTSLCPAFLTKDDNFELLPFLH